MVDSFRCATIILKKYSRDLNLAKQAIALYPFDWGDITGARTAFHTKKKKKVVFWVAIH